MTSTKKKTKKTESGARTGGPSVPTLTPHDRLAREAAEWDDGIRTPAGFEDAPDAAWRASESKPVSLRLPRPMLEILKRFAEREGIGYQVLIKRWLDDRVRVERERIRGARAATEPSGQDRG